MEDPLRRKGMYHQLFRAFLYLAIPPLPDVDIDIISKLTMTSWFETCGTMRARTYSEVIFGTIFTHAASFLVKMDSAILRVVLVSGEVTRNTEVAVPASRALVA